MRVENSNTVRLHPQTGICEGWDGSMLSLPLPLHRRGGEVGGGMPIADRRGRLACDWPARRGVLTAEHTASFAQFSIGGRG
jgi:hypothetical protein